MEQSVTRVSGKGKIARVLLAALLSLVGLTVVGVGSAYAASLSVKSVTPATGPTAGGTTVTVTGSGFSGVTGVTFGGVPAESFTPGTALKLTAVAPAAASSTAVVDVQVVTSGGTSPIVPADEYTYTWSAAPVVTGVSPSAGPIAGGTSVTITGSNLAGASAVTFGTTAATSFHINSDNSITATAPASASPAQSDITVTTPFSGSSTSATSRADLYNWVTTPTLTGVTTVANPAGGPAGGGTQVQILGTGFSSVSAVDFGATPATSFLTNSLGSISAIAPAGTGTVDVTVTTPLGTTATSSADQYTYNSTFTVVPGTASYSSGVSTSTGSTANPTIVDSFNPLTLVTGGGTIDPTKTVIVTQPASGTVAVSGNQIKYTPVQSTPTSQTVSGVTTWTYDTTTTGTQTATIALCQTGFTYPSSGCQTTTITYLQAQSGYYMGEQLSVLGGAIVVSVVIDSGSGVDAPTTAASGSVITTTTAPPMALIPSTNSGFTVTGAGLYQAITPVPAGLTLVPGSLHVTGGDPSSTGKYVVNECTAAMGYIAGECTAQFTGNYKATYPYIETSLNSGTLIPGGAQLTLPTVTAQWTVTATSGTINAVETEFATSTVVATIGNLLLDAYPSDLASYNDQGQNAPVPNYAAPAPRYSINVTGGGPTPPTITSADATAFTAGSAGTFTVTASGDPAPTFSETGALPSGVTLNSTTGVLSGTPAAGTGGSYPITITATNGNAPDATQDFTLTVNQAPTITSGAAKTFTVGTSGTFTATANGYPAPTFTETGALPSGVTLSSAGVLSGTPAAGTGGTYDITITASNGTAPNATQPFVITVDQAPTITSASSTTFSAGTSGTFTATASGFPAPTFSETGALPSGVTLSSAGVLSGTPAAGTGGSYPITITATNGISPDATQNFTLTVNQAPGITSGASTTFTVGTAGTFTATATGFPAPTFSETGALPSGVTFSSSGVLSGTPILTSAGTYHITITASNGVSPNATQPFTLTVITVPVAPTITSASSTSFKVGAAGTFTVTATGNPAPTFSETGALPSGVTLNATSGVLSGTPATGSAGSYPITITATNGVSPDATQDFTLTVGQSPVITSANSAMFAEGTAGSFTVVATGSPAPTFSETGALPSGVTLNSTTGVLSGTPATGTGGLYSITITATNGVSPDATQPFSLTVTAPPTPPVITSGDTATFVAGTAGTFSVTATGYPVPTFTESGALPSGVTLSSAGLLSGTPGAGTGGTYAITITAANGNLPNATQSFTLTVNQKPAITSAAAATFDMGQAGTFTVTSTGYPTTTLSETGALPAGVTFTSGVLAGTPVLGTAGRYPVTFTATNGITPDATQSFTLTVATVPDAPTILSVTPGDGQVTVKWTPGADGGRPILSYLAGTPDESHLCQVNAPATSCTVTGLTNGTAYQFTVVALNVDGPSMLATLSAPVTPTSNGPIPGYWMATSGGAVLTNGAAVSYGSPAGLVLNSPIVALTPTPDRKGYWLVGSDGGVFSYGDAGYYGSTGAEHLNKPIVGMATTSDGKGYWLVASDGGVFAYGDARFSGSLGATVLNAPIVGIAGNGTGGYWLVAADGGVFAYGSATFHGSAGAEHLVSPVVGIAPTADGSGYYLAAADGGVFAYNAPFYGSAAGIASGAVKGITSGNGGGYTLATSTGAVYAYGTAYHGNQSSSGATSPVISVAS